MCTERRKISLLKYVKIRKQCDVKVTELVDVGASIVWGHFMDGVIEACEEVCGRKRGRRSKGETWWLNGDMKEAVPGKNEAHKAMCQNCTEENKRRYERMKNKAKNSVL